MTQNVSKEGRKFSLPLISNFAKAAKPIVYESDLETRRNSCFKLNFGLNNSSNQKDEDQNSTVKENQFKKRNLRLSLASHTSDELKKEMIKVIQQRKVSDFSEQKKRRDLSTYQSDCDSECGTPRQGRIRIRKNKNSSSSLAIRNDRNTLNSSFNDNSNTCSKENFKIRFSACNQNNNELGILSINTKSRNISDASSNKFTGSPLCKSMKKNPLPLHPNYKKKDVSIAPSPLLKVCSQDVPSNSMLIADKLTNNSTVDFTTNISDCTLNKIKMSKVDDHDKTTDEICTEGNKKNTVKDKRKNYYLMCKGNPKGGSEEKKLNIK